MINLAELSPRNKLIVVGVVVVPLFLLIFHVMSQTAEETRRLFYQCPNGTMIELTEATRDGLCGNPYIMYDDNTKTVYVFNQKDMMYQRYLNKITNLSAYLPD